MRAGRPANGDRRAGDRTSFRATTLPCIPHPLAFPPRHRPHTLSPRGCYGPRAASSAVRAGALGVDDALLGWAPGSLSSTALAIDTIGTERS